MSKDLTNRLAAQAEAAACRRVKTLLIAHAAILAEVEAWKAGARGHGRA